VGRDASHHDERVRRLAAVLAKHGPPPGPAFDCPYLPGRQARQVLIAIDQPAPGTYNALMDLNFRRLGRLFYRPECDGCQECRMIRVSSTAFRPTRSQRRCWARNADVQVEAGPPEPSAEKHDLYRRYLAARHEGQMDGSQEEFEGFLYSSCIETLEVVYRIEDRLAAVGIVDAEPEAWSAVYCYFDPDLERRALGVFNVLWLLEECRRRGIPNLYLGFYVQDCARMSYKAGYRPHEIRRADGTWQPYGDSG
jgi:arginyl-tRNA--protein-N-Asp/Glu arginylyltransferase